jgi:hypothetical protein
MKMGCGMPVECWICPADQLKNGRKVYAIIPTFYNEPLATPPQTNDD